MSYIEIDRKRFCEALESKGFTIAPNIRGELVYEFQHLKDPTMYVVVYTSLPPVSGNSRGKGKDAIRVFLMYRNETRSGPLSKSVRVYRTGTEQSVIERTLQRAREAYQHGTDWLKLVNS